MDKLAQELEYLEENFKWFLAYIFDVVRSKKMWSKKSVQMHIIIKYAM